MTPPQVEVPATDDLRVLKATAKLVEGYGYDVSHAPARALACYEEVVRMEPGWALAFLQVAYSRERMGQDSGAKAAYRRALALGDASIRDAVKVLRPSLVR